MNQPTGRCPACGIWRFLPSGLCDQDKCPGRRPEPENEFEVIHEPHRRMLSTEMPTQLSGAQVMEP